LTTQSTKAFYERAVQLGHDTEKLAAGETIETLGTFANLGEGRPLLSVATPEQRKARQASFLTPPLVARQRLYQGRHDFAESILFADSPFIASDHDGPGNCMPARIKAVSILQKTVRAGETWDLTVLASAWGTHEAVDVSTTVNIGELVLEPGAKLIVQGNVFSLLCQRLVCQAPVSGDDFHIGLLPTPFSYDIKIAGQINGQLGAAGKSGLDGYDGEQAQISPQLIGHTLTHPITHEAMCGTHGTDAGHGEHGSNGGNGGMLKIAEITIHQLEGELTVLATAGNGGDGGKGGDGGDGGHGGHGAMGYRLITSVLPGGNGGHAGHGGHGGNGGKGGNGGLVSNIYINVPPNAEAQVHCLSFGTDGGKGAPGGRGGAAGMGGNAGQGPTPGIAGQNGIAGTAGKAGKDGRSRAAAWMFVNEKPRTGTADALAAAPAAYPTVNQH
jgi:hypothetical protein